MNARILMTRLALLVLALIFGHATFAMAADAAYTLTIKDHKFQPTEIEIPAGKKIELLVKNEDPTPEEFESTELKREKVVPGGQQITVYIGPLKPGRYEFFGDFNPTTARGHIVVK
jgi:plastocyanin